MERDKRPRQRYQEVLQELDTALFWLERPTAERGYASDAQRSEMFHLGEADGLAFLRHPQGIKAPALGSLCGAAIPAVWKEGARQCGEPSQMGRESQRWQEGVW